MTDIRCAVITGASSGIGRAAAKALADRGYGIIAAARRLDRLEELKREIGAAHPGLPVVPVRADLSTEDDCRGLYRTASAYPVKIWMNNAGRGNEGDILTEDIDRDLQMLRLNCMSVYLLSVLFARDHADEPDAALINVASVGGYMVFPGSTFYCATKYFVSSFTEGLAQELAAKGHTLRVKILAPAATETEFEQAAHDSAEKVDYSERFSSYETADSMARRVLDLLDGRDTVCTMDFAASAYVTSGPRLPSGYRTRTNRK